MKMKEKLVARWKVMKDEGGAKFATCVATFCVAGRATNLFILSWETFPAITRLGVLVFFCWKLYPLGKVVVALLLEIQKQLSRAIRGKNP